MMSRQVSMFLAGLLLSGCDVSKSQPRLEGASAEKSCVMEFLASDSAWHARYYQLGNMRREISEKEPFTPLQRMWVRDGVLYAQTWGSEALPVEISRYSGRTRITPKYLVWLGIEDEIGRDAKQVAKYSATSTIHHLEIIGSCKAPSELHVRIINHGAVSKGFGEIETVIFEEKV